MKKCPKCKQRVLTKSKIEIGKYSCPVCHDWYTEEEVDENRLIHV